MSHEQGQRLEQAGPVKMSRDQGEQLFIQVTQLKFLWINIVTQSDKVQKRLLKFRTVPDSRGHFRFNIK